MKKVEVALMGGILVSAVLAQGSQNVSGKHVQILVLPSNLSVAEGYKLFTNKFRLSISSCTFKMIDAEGNSAGSAQNFTFNLETSAAGGFQGSAVGQQLLRCSEMMSSVIAAGNRAARAMTLDLEFANSLTADLSSNGIGMTTPVSGITAISCQL